MPPMGIYSSLPPEIGSHLYISIAKGESQFKVDSMFNNRWRKAMAFEHICSI